ncbi:MAG: sodium:solute symporter [Pirellulaceae bacterium]|nr:sodium:solute symporter [Pirellulaceae bacterium]
MVVHFTSIDWIVLAVYFVGVMLLGFSFYWRSRASADQFTAGGRTLPGWLVGLSIFATYLSSISYLALPGKSFATNWNYFFFSLGLPIAALFASWYFLPMYRAQGEVSAYALLERRFGRWARIYASTFYLIFQIARIGFVMYLMALPMSVIFGWDIMVNLLITGTVVTLYSLVGGIVAVIWADAIQAIVLLLGALIAVLVIMLGMPEGPRQVFDLGIEHHKFSPGSLSLLSLSQTTVWLLVAYGVFENLKNFGIDQSYIQRYIAAKSQSEAQRALWLSAWMYVPVSALFFFIGSSLFAFYQTQPAEKQEVRRIVAHQRLMQQGIDAGWSEQSAGSWKWSDDYEQQVESLASELNDSDIADRVFPHFIAAHLPVGVTGLLVAAIFAAGMSTVSTSLNSSATLVMYDFYRPLVPKAGERQMVRVLYAATLVWGILGTGTSLALIPLTQTVLDVWWKVSSVLGSGLLGLFLLGVLCPAANSRHAVLSIVFGSLVIAWMIVSPTQSWPPSLDRLRSPFHEYLVIVVGTLSIVGCGFVLSRFGKASNRHGGQS